MLILHPGTTVTGVAPGAKGHLAVAQARKHQLKDMGPMWKVNGRINIAVSVLSEFSLLLLRMCVRLRPELQLAEDGNREDVKHVVQHGGRPGKENWSKSPGPTAN